MSFRLPTTERNPQAREACGDIVAIIEILNPANVAKLPDFRAAICAARRTLAGAPDARAINVVCIRADDERWLISVGRRGGWRKVWNFGTGRD